MATDSSRRPVLKLGVVDLGVETAVLPNGVTVDMAIIRHPGASAIVALDSDGSIAMLRQWRHAIVTCDDADCRMKSGILNRCRGWCIR